MGLWKSPDASETRPQPPDVPPRAGQRSGSPWVVLQHRGGSAPSPESWSGAGEPWPLPFQARWQRGLPHLALSIPPLRLRLAFHMERGTFSIGTASPDVPLRLSGYIPFTKNKLDLKMCEHIRRKKGRWKKNVLREGASWDWGTGNATPLFPTPTHASWRAFHLLRGLPGSERPALRRAGAEPGKQRHSEGRP